MIYLDTPELFGTRDQMVHVGNGLVAKLRKYGSTEVKLLKRERGIQLALQRLNHPQIRVPQSHGLDEIQISSHRYMGPDDIRASTIRYMGHVMEFLPYPNLVQVREDGNLNRYNRGQQELKIILDITRTLGFEPHDYGGVNCLIDTNDNIILIDFELWHNSNFQVDFNAYESAKREKLAHVQH